MLPKPMELASHLLHDLFTGYVTHMLSLNIMIVCTPLTLLGAEQAGRALDESIYYRAILPRASLNTQNFISEASFQEIEAACKDGQGADFIITGYDHRFTVNSN